ncbi:MAG: secretion protein HlyD [Rhodospirillaceae bacterium]|jgi:membrane fusion protein (multidrug efflux system)|nr:secretion protein HlyD [Rhodospirillaceae bacterium]|tara:strand:- start:708 stop:1925 length:1218 start_codon:yes stop_codon:yes gene_type:complete
MPDGTDSKNKKTPGKAPDKAKAALTQAGDDFQASPVGQSFNRRGLSYVLRLGLIGAVAAAALILGGREIYNRINFVYAYDSRIDADLIIVSSRVAGWVTSLEVTEGSEISKGTMLASIDSRESKLRLSELEAQLLGMEAEGERLAAERRLIDRQTTSLYSSELSRLEAAKVVVSSLAPQLRLAKREYQRAQKLFERKVFSRRQLDQADNAEQQIERQHRIAAAELKAARAKLEEAQAERSRLDVLDGDRNMLKHRKAELMAKLEHQKLDLSDRTIKSPVNGVVDKTFIKAGEYVTPGQRLALVHDPSKIWIEANIKETEIRKLRIGQKVEVSIDAYPDTGFEGRVLSVGNTTTSEFALLPSPNPSGNFTKITQRLPVRIAIEQRHGLLRPGMMVEIYIDVRNPDR